MKKWTAVLSVVLLMAAMMPAFAADGNAARLTLLPEQAELETGETLVMTLTVAQTDQPLIGCLLTFELADGYSFESVREGEAIERSELSYSFDGKNLIFMYMDDDVGGSTAHEGDVLATFELKAARAASGAPLRCTATDVVGGTTAQTIQMDAEVTVGTASVTGEDVPMSNQPPHYVEAGGSEQPMVDRVTGQSAAPQPPASESNIITDAEGNRIEVIEPADQSPPRDITEEVLNGPSVTSDPAPTSDAAGEQAQKPEVLDSGEPKPASSANTLWFAVGAALLAAAMGTGAFLKRRSPKTDRANR